jgi:GNAT superfamily N-acetyltransferase
MDIQIRLADLRDIQDVSDILTEAASWLQDRGIVMWSAEELTPESISAAVTEGLFYVAVAGPELAGTVKFQWEDKLFWPDVPAGESAFVHRLAVRRAFAGGEVSGALLRWAAERAQGRFLRLDCEASRPRLKAVYERFGFRHHSDRRIGPYFVARYELEVGGRQRPAFPPR